MSWGEAKWIVDNVGNNVGGGFMEYETPGSYTFTVPAGVTIISVTACGGGGGGGNYNYDSGSYKAGGGGGGGAAVVGRKFVVTPGQALAITVGAGGTVGANGGDTTIGTLLTLGGGKAPLSGNNPWFGGYPGGDGGGWGGHAGYAGSDSYIDAMNPLRFPTPGANGITGCGGSIYYSPAGTSTSPGGGGGGSLGNGGTGAGEYTTNINSDGSRGGGGGGACYAKGNGGKGGTGYVRIGWGVCMD